MAISHPIPNTYGVDLPTGYWRVESIQLLSKAKMEFCVRAYAEVGKHPIHLERHECAYDLLGANPIQQAYVHLKSLDQFAAATDC